MPNLSSTTEQEAVATWPFRYYSTKACVLRNGQVATASCSVVELKFGIESFQLLTEKGHKSWFIASSLRTAHLQVEKLDPSVVGDE